MVFYQHYRPFAEDLLLPEARVRYLQELNVVMKLQRSVLPFEAVVDLSLAQEALRLIDGQNRQDGQLRGIGTNG